ncbi:NADH-cytochrome b5 reductase 3 [Hyla sarda]|uniref:NADH-cytochrome b5 reductase 3 n=1 Tax=Hyla sarda TaxID=327740 RepID=UPI0024C3CBA1|nr:NADH-cytochrome b5 reductase 3 [Hyla sarda]XP_056413517.1 NADH-cytochrome b5 reductase 3 [Hyla sarda]
MVLLTMFGVAAGNYMINKKRKCVTLKDPNRKYRLRLIHKMAINHNTRRFRFALPSTNHTLGIPPGKCIYLSARINDNLVVRPYTPLCCEDKGFVDLLIKVYFKDQNPDFPEGGKMSQYLDNLSIGETIEFQGPKGLFVYQGKGYFAIQSNKRSLAERKFARHVGMIAGGTGLTPMLQLIQTILHDPEDETKCVLLFANKSEEDIILCNALMELQNEYSERFKLWFTVDSASEEWKYSKGFIDSKMIQEHLPPPADDVIILLCGPPAMIKLACKPSLNMLGYDQDMCYVF